MSNILIMEVSRRLNTARKKNGLIQHGKWAYLKPFLFCSLSNTFHWAKETRDPNTHTQTTRCEKQDLIGWNGVGVPGH